MNDLIKINYDTDRPTVLGRDLHAMLEVETPYSKWLPRMCEYGFTEGADYCEVSDNFVHNPQGGRPASDHQLTIDMVGELAKLIRQNGKEIGQNRMFDWLRQNGFLMKYKNIPTQYSMERKLMEIKERTITNPDGSVRTTQTTLITGKGQTYFVSRLLGESA